MDTLGSRGIDAPYDVLVDLLRHEGDHRSGAFADVHQRGVQRHVGIDLVLLHALGPEAVAAAADIPVGHLVHEALQRGCCLGDPVLVEIRVRILDHRIHSGQQPLVHDGQFVIIQRILRGIESVDIRVQSIERIRVPQCAQELALAFLHGLVGELVGQPGRAVGIEIPADRVGAVCLKSRERIYRVALALGHLVAVFVKDKAKNDGVLIAGLAEQEHGLRVQGIEPAAGLVHRFADEGRGEPLLKEVLVLKRIVELRVRHRAGVEPAVDDFGHAAHFTAALGAADRERVHIRPVELCVLSFRIAGQLRELFPAADAGLVAAALALPDVQGSSPVSVAGDAPVLNVLQPVAETALSDVRRDPVDLLVAIYKVIPDVRHLDEPGLARIVKERRAAAPAVRIIMLEFGRGEQKAARAQVLEDFRVGADRAFFDLFLSGLAAHAGEGCSLHKASLRVNELDERSVVLPADSRVVFTESGSDVDDAGTVRHRYIVVAVHEESFLVLLVRSSLRLLVQGLVGPVLQIRALHGREDFVRLAVRRRVVLIFKRLQDLVQKRLRHVHARK